MVKKDDVDDRSVKSPASKGMRKMNVLPDTRYR